MSDGRARSAVRLLGLWTQLRTAPPPGILPGLYHNVTRKPPRRGPSLGRRDSGCWPGPRRWQSGRGANTRPDAGAGSAGGVRGPCSPWGGHSKPVGAGTHGSMGPDPGRGHLCPRETSDRHPQTATSATPKRPNPCSSRRETALRWDSLSQVSVGGSLPEPRYTQPQDVFACVLQPPEHTEQEPRGCGDVSKASEGHKQQFCPLRTPDCCSVSPRAGFCGSPTATVTWARGTATEKAQLTSACPRLQARVTVTVPVRHTAHSWRAGREPGRRDLTRGGPRPSL